MASSLAALFDNFIDFLCENLLSEVIFTGDAFSGTGD